MCNIPSDIANLNNNFRKYDENLIYYISFPKDARNFKNIF